MNKILLDNYIRTDKEIQNETTMNIMNFFRNRESGPKWEVKEGEGIESIFISPDEYYRSIYEEEDSSAIFDKVDDKPLFSESSFINPLIINRFAKQAKSTDIQPDEEYDSEERVVLEEVPEEESFFNEYEDPIIFNMDDEEDRFKLEDREIDVISHYEIDPLLNLSESLELISGFKVPKTIHFENEKLLKSYKINNKNYYPIFIVLTRNRTLLGDLLHHVAGLEYGHCSFAIDPSLYRLYSFGATGGKGKDGGMVIESIKEGPLHDLAVNRDSEYAIYSCFLEESKFKKILTYINFMIKNIHKWTYKFSQLFKIPFGVKDNRRDKLICSEFVAYVLAEGSKKLLGDKHPSLVTPANVVTEDFYFISSGYLKDYNLKHTTDTVNKIARSKEVIKYLNENYSGAANYETFKALYRSAPKEINKLMRKFYPTTLLKPASLLAVTNGGLFYKSIEGDPFKNKGDLLDNYNPEKNAHKVTIDDSDHIAYCYILHQLVSKIFLSGKDVELEDEELADRMDMAIFNQWETRVNIAYDELQEARDPNRIKICKQKLLDLMWDFRDNPKNYIRRNANRYLFAQYMGNIYFPTDEGFISKEEYNVNFRALRKIDDSLFLTASDQYPVFNAIDLELYVAVYPSIESFEKSMFMENWLKKYALFRCDFKIRPETDFAKDLPDEYKFIIDDQYIDITINEN